MMPGVRDYEASFLLLYVEESPLRLLWTAELHVAANPKIESFIKESPCH